MEPKAEKAEGTLSILKRDMQELEGLGLSLKGLAEFNGKLQEIAQHHGIKPSEVRSRLLRELQALDEGVTLETLIRSRQQELDKTEQALIGIKKAVETERAVAESLAQHKTNLEASIKEMRENVMGEIAKIIPLAQDAVAKLGEDLRRGNDEALAELRRLSDEAVEVGREVGRCEGVLQSSEWLNDLLALVRGEEDIEGKRLKVIVLLVVRALHIWLKRRDPVSFALQLLTVENLISELERWKV